MMAKEPDENISMQKMEGCALVKEGLWKIFLGFVEICHKKPPQTETPPASSPWSWHNR